MNFVIYTRPAAYHTGKEIAAWTVMFDAEMDAESLDVPLTAIHMAITETYAEILNPLRAPIDDD